jgi:16S rRNA (uracil1498-N3)-methyltransferase
MPRLYVDPARMAEEMVVVSGEDHRYLTRVLRLGLNDVITLFDGQGREADAIVARVGPRALELRVELRRTAASIGRPTVTLIQALTKGEKLDFIVQKATELGVGRVIPATSARAVPRLELARALGRHARWQKIARDAARQSGRSDVPEVQPITPLVTALKSASAEGLRIFLWEGAKQHPLREALGPLVTGATAGAAPAQKPPQITLAVGPEGGFAEEEVVAAREIGFTLAGLGPRTLRAETAPLAALAILGFVLGDLG